MKMTSGNSRVVQVTNIAPQVTKDLVHALFSFLGKIEEIRLYPTIRDASYPVHSRICYIKFVDASSVAVAQHMTNAVFIDRALIVIAMSSEEIPDERYVLEMTNHGAIVPGLPIKDPKLPPHVVNSVHGSGERRVMLTTDANLDANDLPPYPPLPAHSDSARIEETRRTVLMLNYDPACTPREVIEFFTSAGEVKYLRTCKRDSDGSNHMLVEFTDQPSVVNALKMNGLDFKGRAVEIQHATQPIMKPETKSNAAAQQEIEEAASRFREEQYMMGASKEPVAKVVAKNDRRSRSRSGDGRKRSRSRSRSRRRSSSRSRRLPSHRTTDRSRSRSRSKRCSKPRRRTSTSRTRTKSRVRVFGSTPRCKRSTSRSSKLRRNRSTSKERPFGKQSRDKDRDLSRDRDSNRETRKLDPKELEKDEHRLKGKKGEVNKSGTSVPSEKRVSRRSRSRERKRSRSGGSRRRSPSPHISGKRKSDSRSRDRDRNREKSDRRDNDRKRIARRSKSGSRSASKLTQSHSSVPDTHDRSKKKDIKQAVPDKSSPYKSDMDISNSP